MKNMNGIRIIGIDHGYGNMKTANYCFPSGLIAYDQEPTFKRNLLVYVGKYYSIGIGHKEFHGEKIMDEDYYILTLGAIAMELEREHLTSAAVYLAAGLPLSWVTSQSAAFKEYLLQNKAVDFSFRGTDYDEAHDLSDTLDQQDTDSGNEVLAMFKRYSAIDELTEAHIQEMLDRVTIYPDGRLDVKILFADELNSLAESFYSQRNISR